MRNYHFSTIIFITIFTLVGCNRSTYLKPAGKKYIDEELRVTYPGLTQLLKSESESKGISIETISEVKINDDIKLNQLGNISISGRVFKTETLDIKGTPATKVYLLYSKADTSEFIIKNSKVYSFAGHEQVFPSKLTFPRYLKNTVLKIFTNSDEIKNIQKGDYLSITGLWGNIDFKSGGGQDSNYGTKTFILKSTGHKISKD